MGRTLHEVIASLPLEQQQEIERRYIELEREVANLRELRGLTTGVHSYIAQSLRVTESSVSEMEKQADMYFSIFRSSVEAMGGQLDLIVRLPNGEAVCLGGFADIHRP